MLNMFRALLCPSSGAHGYSADYHIGRSVLGLLPAPNFQPTATQEPDGPCGNQHYSLELLMIGLAVPETCWAYHKYNKTISSIYLVLILRLSFFWCLQPARGTDHSAPCCAKIKNKWGLYVSSHHTPPWCGQRQLFTLCLNLKRSIGGYSLLEMIIHMDVRTVFFVLAALWRRVLW